MNVSLKHQTLLLSALSLILASLFACGREPSRLLRQGQLPIFDFPLYLTEGSAGRIWEFDRNGKKSLILDGLSDPRGIATDRFGNLYVAEYGRDRVLRVDPKSAKHSTLVDNLQSPSTVAVDSFGEVYITLDGTREIVRGSDGKVFASYSSLPTTLVFGVNDIPIVGLFDQNKVFWGWEDTATSTAVNAPINTSIDGTGRVYVAEGSQSGRVIRYHQKSPGSGKVVANNLLGPAGIAVDPVGNIFVAEQGASRIVLISFDGVKYEWVSDLTDPQYLAFTQY